LRVGAGVRHAVCRPRPGSRGLRPRDAVARDRCAHGRFARVHHRRWRSGYADDHRQRPLPRDRPQLRRHAPHHRPAGRARTRRRRPMIPAIRTTRVQTMTKRLFAPLFLSVLLVACGGAEPPVAADAAATAATPADTAAPAIDEPAVSGEPAADASDATGDEPAGEAVDAAPAGAGGGPAAEAALAPAAPAIDEPAVSGEPAADASDATGDEPAGEAVDAAPADAAVDPAAEAAVAAAAQAAQQGPALVPGTDYVEIPGGQPFAPLDGQ